MCDVSNLCSIYWHKYWTNEKDRGSVGSSAALIGTVKKKQHKEDNHNNNKNMMFVCTCPNVVHAGFIRENSTNKIMKFCWLVYYFSWLHYHHSSLSLVQPGHSQNEWTSPARPNVRSICPSHLILPLMSVPLMSKPNHTENIIFPSLIVSPASPLSVAKGTKL